MDLEFESTTTTALSERRVPEWPQGVRVLQRGNSAALSLVVPICDMDLPVGQQLDKIEAALSAAYRLAPFGSIPLV